MSRSELSSGKFIALDEALVSVELSTTLVKIAVADPWAIMKSRASCKLFVLFAFESALLGILWLTPVSSELIPTARFTSSASILMDTG